MITKPRSRVKKVTTNEPITTETFTRLLAHYVQQVSDQYSVPKSTQRDFNRLAKQLKPQPGKKDNLWES
jgi:hypothetical protein